MNTDSLEMITCLANNDLGRYRALSIMQEEANRKEITRKRRTRTCKEYYSFKRDVKKRDSAKCAECESALDIEVHHIKPVNRFPELVFIVDNGICLCRTCHKELHRREGF